MWTGLSSFLRSRSKRVIVYSTLLTLSEWFMSTFNILELYFFY